MPWASRVAHGRSLSEHQDYTSVQRMGGMLQAGQPPEQFAVTEGTVYD